MVVEYGALIKNQTWELVPLVKGKNIAGCKWVCKTKYGVNGQVVRIREVRAENYCLLNSS
jgi:hypothetical protein